jgi:hypothetical protein
VTVDKYIVVNTVWAHLYNAVCRKKDADVSYSMYEEADISCSMYKNILVSPAVCIGGCLYFLQYVQEDAAISFCMYKKMLIFLAVGTGRY